MNQSLSTLYRRYRTLALLVVTGMTMLLSFLWYLPGAYNARNMDEYHTYSWRALKFSNILDIYVLHNLDKHDTTNYVLGGIGVDYPVILSVLIRATSAIGVSDGVTTEVYRNSTPPTHANPQDTHTPIGVGTDLSSPAAPASQANVPAYLVVNYAIIFLFGLLTVALMARWPGARPWLFAASPLLLLYAGYNWDTISFALIMAGFLLLKLSIEKPSPGRGYNLLYEIAGFALLAVAVWFKLFPIVFLGAAIIDRARRRLWSASSLGVGVFVVLSLLINVPMMLINYTSWSFYLWFNQNRPAEPSSLWYLLFGSIDLGLPIRPDTTTTINILSLVTVVLGGLVFAVLAWRSPRRDIMMPLSAVLLVWWFTFNKIYDPNFDLSVLFLMAVLSAPRWLYISLTLFGLFWYVTAITGLSMLTFGASPELNAWYVSHVLIFSILVRLALLALIIWWAGRKLLTPDHSAKEPDVLAHDARRSDMLTPALQSGAASGA